MSGKTKGDPAARAALARSRSLEARVAKLEMAVEELHELAVTLRAYARLALVLSPIVTSALSGLIVWAVTRAPK